MKKKMLFRLLSTMLISLLITGCGNKAEATDTKVLEATVSVEQDIEQEAVSSAATQDTAATQAVISENTVRETVVSDTETQENKQTQKEAKGTEKSKTEAAARESVPTTQKPTSTQKPETSAPSETSKPEEKPKAHTCSWDGGSVTQAATCNSEGTMTYTCNGCGATRTEGIPQTSHNFVTQTTEPTCTEPGSSVEVCTICGASQPGSSSGSALGHDFEKYYPFGESTCTMSAYWMMSCSRCGKSAGDGNDPALPHNPVGQTTQVGDCIVPTVIQYYCSECGANCGMDSFTTDDHTWETRASAPVWDEAAQTYVPGPDVTRCVRCGTEQ